MKSEYREPMYKHLINKKPKSRLTKSRNLYLHLFLIEYDRRDDIPYDTIAEISNEKPNKIRGLLRSVNDPKIYLGLVDVGVDSQDIPSWYARPKFIKKIVKAQAKVVEKEVKRPAISNVVSHPLNGVTLPSTFRPYQAPEATTNYYYDAVYGERPLSPAEEVMWRARLKALRDDEREREEERRKEERERRPLTPEERKTSVEAKRLYQEVQNQRHIEEYLIYKTNIDFKAASDRAIFEKDLEESLQLVGDAMANVGQVLAKMRTPPPSTKIEPFILSGNEDQYENLRKLNQQKDKEKMDGILAVAKLGRDIQEKNRRDKRNRHWRFHADNEYIRKQVFGL